jgi:hypothetical protein
MADAIKTESIDELVAFLVSQLPDPEKTEFITEVHEKIKCIEEMWEEDVGGIVCEKFNEWMHSDDKFKGYLHAYGAPNPGLGLDLFREKLFEFSYNSVLSGMRNQLLSLLDDIISEIYEWY